MSVFELVSASGPTLLGASATNVVDSPNKLKCQNRMGPQSVISQLSVVKTALEFWSHQAGEWSNIWGEILQTMRL